MKYDVKLCTITIPDTGKTAPVRFQVKNFKGLTKTEANILTAIARLVGAMCEVKEGA